MTNDARQGSPDRRFTAWIGATVVLFLVAVAVGFIWLPSAQRGPGDVDFWGAICRAVGLQYGRLRVAAPPGAEPASTVAWTTATRLQLTQGNAVHGAALATTCNNCHGTSGISADAAFPNLVGQSVAAIYKQLEDFNSGKRSATVMGVYVLQLSEQDMLDVATHFASLPDPFAATASTLDSTDSAAGHLIQVGSPLRGIAPCAACHGPLGLTPGAPGLRGQQRAYLEQQMQAFAAGSRHNDISEQMRSVARQLTGVEIALLAADYSNVPSIPGQ
jgi:cytochrome c553